MLRGEGERGGGREGWRARGRERGVAEERRGEERRGDKSCEQGTDESCRFSIIRLSPTQCANERQVSSPLLFFCFVFFSLSLFFYGGGDII